jgi:hypothetical protein
MTAIKALILGIIQGLAEFLPISSSGHLTVAGALMGMDPEGDSLFAFNILPPTFFRFLSGNSIHQSTCSLFTSNC